MRDLSMILASLIFFLGCEQYSEVKSTEYYNLDSLLSAQISYMADRDIILNKIAQVNDETEEETFKADSALWAEELAIFRDLDLNKPGTLNAYEKFQDGSRIEYNLKPDEKQEGVITMVVTLKDGAPETINAQFIEDNSLYTSDRMYELTFDEEAALKTYKITGKQKVAFGDWVEYEVFGKIGK